MKSSYKKNKTKQFAFCPINYVRLEASRTLMKTRDCNLRRNYGLALTRVQKVLLSKGLVSFHNHNLDHKKEMDWFQNHWLIGCQVLLQTCGLFHHRTSWMEKNINLWFKIEINTFKNITIKFNLWFHNYPEAAFNASSTRCVLGFQYFEFRLASRWDMCIQARFQFSGSIM